MSPCVADRWTCCTVVISGLVGLVCCGSGLDGVVRYGDVGLSNTASMMLMWVSPSDSIPCYCPIPVEARVLLSWWGLLPGPSCINYYLRYSSFVPVYVLMSPSTCRCVLLPRNLAQISARCFCVTTWLMAILPSFASYLRKKSRSAMCSCVSCKAVSRNV